MKDYVDARLMGKPGDMIPVLRLSAGGLLEDHLIVSEDDDENLVLASSPSVMDDADYWNYIISDCKGGVFAIHSANLDFEV